MLYEGSENAALISSVRVLGHVKAATVVSGLVSARMENRPNECVELLLILSEDSSRCFPEVAESAVAGLDRIGIRDSKSDADDWEPEGRRRPLSPQFLVNLLEALRRFESRKLFTTAAEKVSARPEAFNPVTLIVPALQQIFDARGEGPRHLIRAWCICGPVRPRSCSVVAKFRRNRHRIGV